MRTLEQYLKDCAIKGVVDHRLRYAGNNQVFIHHVDAREWDTLNFKLDGNELDTVHDTRRSAEYQDDLFFGAQPCRSAGRPRSSGSLKTLKISKIDLASVEVLV